MTDTTEITACEPNDGLTLRVRRALRLNGAITELYVAGLMSEDERAIVRGRLLEEFEDVFGP